MYIRRLGEEFGKWESCNYVQNFGHDSKPANSISELNGLYCKKEGEENNVKGNH